MNLRQTLENLKTEFIEKDRTVEQRIEWLKQLKSVLKKDEHLIYEALYNDLSKNKYESYTSELALIFNEIDYFIKNLKKIVKPEKVKNFFPYWFASKNLITRKARGVCLIIAPYNYPFQLSLVPLVGAIASGNLVMLKNSPSTFSSNGVIKKILGQVFANNQVYVVDNKEDDVMTLFDLDFDHVFFTGSTKIGKLISEKFTPRSIPITLELGGKSPTIIDKTANLENAVKKIIWGKVLNAGQTCIAPDYCLVHTAVYDEFRNLLVRELKNQVQNFVTNDRYGKIIDKVQFERLVEIIKKSNVVSGGNYDSVSLKIEPTVVEVKAIDEAAMMQEIFGPIMPLYRFSNNKELLNLIKKNPNPLTIYLFANDKAFSKFLYNKTDSGSFVINDTIMQITKYLPFGGIKSSGLGSYHAYYSYLCFTYERPVVITKKADNELRYNPYKVSLKKLQKFI